MAFDIVAYNEALGRLLWKLDRVADSDAVTVDKADLRVVLGALADRGKALPSRTPRTWTEHDEQPDGVKAVCDNRGDEWELLGGYSWRLVDDKPDERGFVQLWTDLTHSNEYLREVIR